MTLQRILQYAHTLMRSSVTKNDAVIDATCGNGHDTLFLSELVGVHGHVFAFDIQEQAIVNAKQLIDDNHMDHVTFIHDSHENVDHYIPNELKGQIGGAIFNLGYLPGSDKLIVTKSESTIKAIEKIIDYLKKDGLIVIVIYHGHEGGSQEKEAVLDYCSGLSQKHYAVLKYEFINQKNNPPFIVAIQKK